MKMTSRTGAFTLVAMLGIIYTFAFPVISKSIHIMNEPIAMIRALADGR